MVGWAALPIIITFSHTDEQVARTFDCLAEELAKLDPAHIGQAHIENVTMWAALCWNYLLF